MLTEIYWVKSSKIIDCNDLFFRKKMKTTYCYASYIETINFVHNLQVTCEGPYDLFIQKHLVMYNEKLNLANFFITARW